jgi:hypothetical protein
MNKYIKTTKMWLASWCSGHHRLVDRRHRSISQKNKPLRTKCKEESEETENTLDSSDTETVHLVDLYSHGFYGS